MYVVDRSFSPSLLEAPAPVVRHRCYRPRQFLLNAGLSKRGSPVLPSRQMDSVGPKRIRDRIACQRVMSGRLFTHESAVGFGEVRYRLVWGKSRGGELRVGGAEERMS